MILTIWSFQIPTKWCDTPLDTIGMTPILQSDSHDDIAIWDQCVMWQVSMQSYIMEMVNERCDKCACRPFLMELVSQGCMLSYIMEMSMRYHGNWWDQSWCRRLVGFVMGRENPLKVIGKEQWWYWWEQHHSRGETPLETPPPPKGHWGPLFDVTSHIW